MFRTAIIIYLVGFIVSGLITLMLYKNNDFYQFQLKAIKDDLKANDIILSQDELEIYLSKDIKLTMFLSYLELFSIIIQWAHYIKIKSEQ